MRYCKPNDISDIGPSPAKHTLATAFLAVAVAEAFGVVVVFVVFFEVVVVSLAEATAVFVVLKLFGYCASFSFLL